MAKLELTTVMIPTTVMKREVQYQLTLTKEELVFIRMIVGNVSGTGPLRLIADGFYKTTSPYFMSGVPPLAKPIGYIILDTETEQQKYLDKAIPMIIPSKLYEYN